MPINEELKALVDQLPDPDKRGMYTENIDKEKIEQITAKIHAGGRDNVLGIIDMLGKPGAAENVKPHYALRCLGIHVLKLKDENARRQFSETLASRVGDEKLSTYNRAYLCQELQYAGRKEATPALQKLLLDEELVEPASMALAAIRDGAAEQFRAALPKAKGKCLLNIVDGLAALGDPESAGAFKQNLEDGDREVRIAAGAGLAKVGGPDAVAPMLKAADVEPGWERVQATKNCMVLAENLLKAGKKSDAKKIYTHLRDTRKDLSEKYIRDAAEKALSAAGL